jgi:adenine deaminase
MSDESAEVVAKQAKGLLEGFRQCGCKMNNPNMQSFSGFGGDP